MQHNGCGFKRFIVGYVLFLVITVLLAYSLQQASLPLTPLKASMRIEFLNTGNTTAQEAEIRFIVVDFQNSSRINFTSIVSQNIQGPNNTIVEPDADGKGLDFYVPWQLNEHILYLIDNISLSPDFPVNLSSLGTSRPITVEPQNTSWKLDYDVLLTVVGRTYYGTYSIASLYQFSTANEFVLETRTDVSDYTALFFVLLIFLACLVLLMVWSPKIWRRLPFMTFVLALFMVFLYAFVGSGIEITLKLPSVWQGVAAWTLGIFTHAFDSHIAGNLTVFLPLSLLFEIWMNVKASKRTMMWYAVPIAFAMLIAGIFRGIGFSLADEFLAWGLWSLIIIQRKVTTRIDILLCLLSGVVAYTFWTWVFTSIFSPAASIFSQQEAEIHILLGAISGLVSAVLTYAVIANQRTEKTRISDEED